MSYGVTGGPGVQGAEASSTGPSTPAAPLYSQSTDTVPALGSPNLAGVGGTCVKQRMTVNDSPDEAWGMGCCKG